MQMMMLSSNGSGSGFMMKSVKTFDAEDPSRNYEHTQTTQFSQDGVVEAREEVRDGRRGVERIGLRRQLGDQYSQVERSRRAATGEESAKRTLHNVADDDVDRFDAQWMAAASRSLPTYRRARSLAPPSSRAIAAEPVPARPSLLLEAPQDYSDRQVMPAITREEPLTTEQRHHEAEDRWPRRGRLSTHRIPEPLAAPQAPAYYNRPSAVPPSAAPTVRRAEPQYTAHETKHSVSANDYIPRRYVSYSRPPASVRYGSGPSTPYTNRHMAGARY
eukprot:EG_transcript_15464